jgi:putative membrane protein
MIKYETKNWSKTVFSYHGTILSAVFPRLAVIGGLCLLLQLFSLYVFKIPKIEALAHSLLGVALGLLLVFRNNSSYDRYWEGRKAWGGIVNASRNLARLVSAYTGAGKTFSNLITAYVIALKYHLRKENSENELKKFIDGQQLAYMLKQNNVPLAIAFYMSCQINAMLKSKEVTINQIVVMEGMVSELLNHQGVCERILNTPIPFCHASHISQLLCFYLFSLPFVLIPTGGWIGMAASLIIAFGLLGIEAAGVEIEDPFGTDPNDLPIEDLCRTVENNTAFLADMQGIHRDCL